MTDWIENVLAAEGLVLQLPALLLLGVFAHFLLGFVVHRLHAAALNSVQIAEALIAHYI